MKFSNFVSAVAATAIAFVGGSSAIASPVIGSAAAPIMIDGCLIPAALDGTVLSSEIAIHLDSALSNQVLLEGSTYGFEFSGGVGDPGLLDPACITDGEITITYDVTYLVDDARLDVGGDIVGAVLLDTEVVDGVPMFFDLTVKAGLGAIESYDATVLAIVDAVLSYTEAPATQPVGPVLP